MIKVHTIETKEFDGKYYAEASLSNFKICNPEATRGTIELRYLCDSRREAAERLIYQLKKSKIPIDDYMEVHDLYDE